MMLFSKKAFAFSAVAAFGFSLAALASDYTVDASHSNVGFTIRHMVSKVSGDFKDFEGEFKFDDKKVENSMAKFTIKTASVSTNNQKRDDHLKSGDFFDTDKYPTITFESKKVTKAGKNKYKLMGDMTMHGVTKSVTFDVEYMGTDKDPYGNTKAGFVATSVIKRKDFGIVWNKALDSGNMILGDDVTVNLQIEAAQKKAEEKK